MDLNKFLKRIEVDPQSFQPGSHAVWRYNDPSGESGAEATLTWDTDDNEIHAVVSETIQGDTSIIFSLDMNADCTGIKTKGVEEEPGQSLLATFAEAFRENVVQMERV